VGTYDVQPVSVVRNLGMYINSDVTLRAQLTAIVRACFAVLRQIRSVRHCLPRDAAVTLVRALVISKVDYCNSMMAGASSTQLRRLQSVLNAAARLVSSASKYEIVTWLLRQLHWLKVPERINFQMC